MRAHLGDLIVFVACLIAYAMYILHAHSQTAARECIDLCGAAGVQRYSTWTGSCVCREAKTP